MKKLLFLLIVVTPSFFAQSFIAALTGKAFTSNYGYYMIRDVCDLAGGRLMGSEPNKEAFEMLKKELENKSLKPFYEKFTSPVWFRGEDKVVLKLPFRKNLRAYALAWVSPAKIEDAKAVFVYSGYEEDYRNLDVKGKIVVISQERPSGRDELLRGEAIKIAAAKGAVACLFINEAKGGKVLCGVGNFKGDPLKIPAFTLTFEEGAKLRRLLERKVNVVLDVVSNSRVETGESNNLVARIDGTGDEKIVIGGHFDSWDLGDGAADNGHGSAVMFEAAALLKEFGVRPKRTIEFVWFNGEETGLWGSKKYVEAHKNDKIFAMINLDMPGKINGFNVMGFDSLSPAIKSITDTSGSFDLSKSMSTAWTNSDHMYFMFNGIPVITPVGGMTKEMTDHYHDFGDSFDKLDKDYISHGAAAVAFLATGLADSDFKLFRLSPGEVKELLKKHNLEKRLKKQEEYPF